MSSKLLCNVTLKSTSSSTMCLVKAVSHVFVPSLSSKHILTEASLVISFAFGLVQIIIIIIIFIS